MTLRDVLVRRSGLVVLPAGAATGQTRLAQAVALELAALGYVPSHRLQARLETLDGPALATTSAWLCGTLAAGLGADQKHTPLFRRFPKGVPDDTFALWVQKVLSHYLQGEDEPCLFCGAVGTTHVLRPCCHVVCDRCFDGSNYSRCPVCERAVDPGSPFFRPGEIDRAQRPTEQVTFKRLDLCEDADAAACALYQSLITRAQALSPDDVLALHTIIGEYGLGLLPWTPDKIPVRENRAHLFGTLLRSHPPQTVLDAARPHLGTATDVMRLVAAYSGADPGLQPVARSVVFQDAQTRRWSGKTTGLINRFREIWRRYNQSPAAPVAIQSARFKIRPISRPLRRQLLALLESMPADAVAEDMGRRPSLWVRLGEVLHPFELADRYPQTARAFAIVRGTTGKLAGQLAAPVASSASYARDSRGRLRFVPFYAQMERLIAAADPVGLAQHLAARPGELARRIDLLLRLEARTGRTGAAELLRARIDRVATPLLLGLCASLSRRDRAWPVRVYFPKGAAFQAPSSRDARVLLPASATAPLVEAIERELLRRFAERPAFEAAVIDADLSTIIVPFNERSASPAAAQLPRGSSVAVPPGKVARLFLHWCQPEKGADTDNDLSVALYGEDWRYIDFCSYYSLKVEREDRIIATSSGDVRDAPFPDGGSEFIDLHRDAALASGIRYAVMVVNAYAGLPFSALDRCFAGIMLRDDTGGAVFDPRTVRLRFNLNGEHGIYLPLVLDLAESRLFWLDAYTTGQFAFNNVATSATAIQRICPETMRYFGHGVRPSMFQLAALHAAARCGVIEVVAGDAVLRYRRRDGEDAHGVYRRVLGGDPDQRSAELPPVAAPVFAALLEGDLPLPDGSEVYALFREAVTNPIAASDLLSSHAASIDKS